MKISDRCITLNLDSCFIKENEHNKYHTVGTVLKYHTVGTVLKYHTVGTVLIYHTVGTVPQYHTVGTVPQYHTVGTVPNSYRKLVTRGNIESVSFTYKYMTTHCPGLYRHLNKGWRD